MTDDFPLVAPRLAPVLDPDFRPPVLALRAWRDLVRASGGGVPLGVAIEREGGRISRHDTWILPDGHPAAAANFAYVERLVKALLWQWGGWKISLGGSPELGRFLRYQYSTMGARRFDAQLWGSFIYERPLVVESLPLDALPPATDLSGTGIRFDWSGWRIAFDLGAGDRKVAVLKDGQMARSAAGPPLLSDEFSWDPRTQANPEWHCDKINEIINLALEAIQMEEPGAKVSAIGGSSAGVFVGNRVRIASLFRGVEPRERFERDVAPLFDRLASRWGVPFRLENDGDVTALAAAHALGDGAVLGLAMGSTYNAGYVDGERRIVGWMNELGFSPVDYNPAAPVDEWSGDRGVAASYFSQQGVARLIPVAGIAMDDLPLDAEARRLARVQELLADGDLRARQIFETVGRWFGYTLPLYAECYQPLRHVEVLGRVMTGEGGRILMAEARRVLATEFPELATSLRLHEPNDLDKRHGLVIAAASLPNA